MTRSGATPGASCAGRALPICPSGGVPRHNALANGMYWVSASRWRRSALIADNSRSSSAAKGTTARHRVRRVPGPSGSAAWRFCSCCSVWTLVVSSTALAVMPGRNWLPPAIGHRPYEKAGITDARTGGYDRSRRGQSLGWPTLRFGDLISCRTMKKGSAASAGKVESVSEYASSCIDMRADEVLTSACA